MSNERNLEELINEKKNVVDWLRHLPTDTWEFVGVPSEFTNWPDEQMAAHESVVILHQGHMRDPLGEFYIKGPDAFQLLSALGANSFKAFKPGQAKQYLLCNYDGYLIGDAILFYLAENNFCLIGGMTMYQWITFQAKKGDYNVTLAHQDSIKDAAGNEKLQDYYQLQIQGPKAKALIEKLNGSFPDVKFFHLGELTIAGKKVRALRHSMAGEPGLEIWFPREYRQEVVSAIVAAGEEFGLKQVGTKTYPTQTLESGWMGMPIPAIYSGDKMREYREYLSTSSFECVMSIAGSFVSDKIEDYYYTPYDMNYGQFVKFDHDFIGREALEKMSKENRRRKVTLLWNPEDVRKIWESAGDTENLPYKNFEMPWAPYGMVQCDRVSKHGKTVGRSADVGYSRYVRGFLSLAVVEADVQIGDEVIVTWGEEAGGTRKNSVERHRQLDIRAKVCPAPYTQVAREQYQSGWRTANA